MTKCDFVVISDEKGYIHITVTRLSDSAKKEFFQAHSTVERMVSFMNSITDEQADGYFPKHKKK